MALIDELYWYLTIGKPKRRLSVFQLRDQLNEFLVRPVFFLSTGRCGTLWFTDLLAKDSGLAVFHSPVPSLAIQGKVAWKVARENDFRIPGAEYEMLSEIFLAGREQHLRYTAKGMKRYVETNNYVTFFAPVIAKLFPDACFVHLVRHPVEFIRSGLDRGYYLPNNVDDLKRIQANRESTIEWSSLSRFGRVAWLWNETNAFIDDFLQTIPSEQKFFLKFSQPGLPEIQKMLSFLQVAISENQVKSKMNRKKNVQKDRSTPSFSNWGSAEKSEVLKLISPLAEKYQFNI